MKNLKPLDYVLISELVRNPKMSDREIAKIANVSQPMISRRRSQLEKMGLLDCTAILDVRKLGFEILAITFGKSNSKEPKSKEAEPNKDFLSRHPEMVLISSGSGLNYERVILSVHRKYADYSKFIRELRQEWSKYIEEPESFIISLQSDEILRDFTLKHMAESITKELS